MGQRNLTKVRTEHIEGVRNFRLLFGSPIYTKSVNSQSDAVIITDHFFEPASIFGLDLWEQNAYGTRAWAFYVVQAIAPDQRAQGIIQVSPGGRILLKARGKRAVQRALKWLREIEKRYSPEALPPEVFEAAELRLRVRKSMELPSRLSSLIPL
jgi:hypothetical protein